MSLKSNNELREKYTNQVIEFFKNQGEDVLIIGSNEICFPVVDSQGLEQFIVLKIQVPKGDRDGGAYDGYELANEYETKRKAKEKEKELKEQKKLEEQEKRKKKKESAQ